MKFGLLRSLWLYCPKEEPDAKCALAYVLASTIFLLLCAMQAAWKRRERTAA